MDRLPTWLSSRSAVYRSFNKNIPVIPTLPDSNVPDLAAIPNKFQITWESREDPAGPPQVYLLHRSGEGEPLLLIFGTPLALEVLHQSAHWVCDGTFKYCPQSFYQMYSIHGFLAGEAAPLVIALMVNKLEVCCCIAFCKLHFLHTVTDYVAGFIRASF